MNFSAAAELNLLEAWNRTMFNISSTDCHQINGWMLSLRSSIREVEELTLEVIIAEAKAQAEILVPRARTEVEQLLVGSSPIQRTDSTCPIFRLIFDPPAYGVLHGAERIVSSLS